MESFHQVDTACDVAAHPLTQLLERGGQQRFRRALRTSATFQ
jgi:hypothetical protein